MDSSNPFWACKFNTIDLTLLILKFHQWSYPIFFWKHHRPFSLDLGQNELTGQIPFELANLTQLTHLQLFYNLISGQIPFELTNLTQLTLLDLSDNNLTSQIPSSITNLENLEFFYLSDNFFNGTVEFNKFFKPKKLTTLHLSYNHVSLLISETSANRTLQKFQ